MTAPLEQTYGRLLRLYPAAFRRQRGAEMLDTLLQAADDSGRSRPEPREVAALVLSALRMRCGRDPRTTARQNWLTAIHTGALLLIVHGIAETVVPLGFGAVLGIPAFWELHGPAWIVVGGPALGLIALVLALRGRHLLAAVALLPAGFAGLWTLLAAAALLTTLVGRRPPRATGLLRYLPVAPLLLTLSTQFLAQVLPQVAGILRFGLLVALCLAGLLWLAVDERVAMALGLLYLGDLAITVGYSLTWDVASYSAVAQNIAFTALPPALMLGFATETARRHVKL